MMASQYDVKNAVVDLLETNITDPIASRLAAGMKWIYYDFPRPDISAYPRIGVEIPTAPATRLATATGQHILSHQVQVLVLIKRRMKLKVGVDTYDDQRSIDYLTELVSNELTDLSNASFFHGRGVYSIKLISDNLIGGNDAIFGRLLTLQMNTIRGG